MKKLLALLAILPTMVFAEPIYSARYGVAETFDFFLYNADGTLDVDEADGGTEVALACNEGAETTATNDFVDEGTFYSIALTAAELQCKRVAVIVNATVVGGFVITTHGNASAMTPSFAADTIAISGDATAADTLETAFDGTAGPVASLGIVDQGTAQSATATTVVLRAAAALGDDTANGMLLLVCGSTQTYCQSRVVTDYVNSTDTATVSTWAVTPSGTITYYLFGSSTGTVDANIVSFKGVDSDAVIGGLSVFDSTTDKVNVGKMNDADVCGTGQSGDDWDGCP